ncbi:hypothetical protein [Streptomyces phyllanthi]
MEEREVLRRGPHPPAVHTGVGARPDVPGLKGSAPSGYSYALGLLPD